MRGFDKWGRLMFRVIGDKIYFNEYQVAKIDPWIRDTVRFDLAHELDHHTKAQDVEQMKERIARLEAELAKTSKDELLGAKW